jgi:hypothetical protein
MKIEEDFRDLNRFFGLVKLMKKRRDQMKKSALVLIVYTIFLWLGETSRASVFLDNSRKHFLSPASWFF